MGGGVLVCWRGVLGVHYEAIPTKLSSPVDPEVVISQEPLTSPSTVCSSSPRASSVLMVQAGYFINR
ncbi:hypothetical protein E2C01_047042 [Portunus trituberculatus]|uniref:Uncharacterized protein n=1 Tax=Portunus trituberculatus TaxID=210409 RepID=A0A5B7G6N8_PORTR|nr:hypothetical protein [Portunus trituberculatus]